MDLFNVILFILFIGLMVISPFTIKSKRLFATVVLLYTIIADVIIYINNMTSSPFIYIGFDMMSASPLHVCFVRMTEENKAIVGAMMLVIGLFIMMGVVVCSTC